MFRNIKSVHNTIEPSQAEMLAALEFYNPFKEEKKVSCSFSQVQTALPELKQITEAMKKIYDLPEPKTHDAAVDYLKKVVSVAVSVKFFSSTKALGTRLSVAEASLSQHYPMTEVPLRSSGWTVDKVREVFVTLKDMRPNYQDSQKHLKAVLNRWYDHYGPADKKDKTPITSSMASATVLVKQLDDLLHALSRWIQVHVHEVKHDLGASDADVGIDS